METELFIKTLNAIYFVVAPYLDYDQQYVTDEHIYIAELVDTYNNLIMIDFRIASEYGHSRLIYNDESPF